MFQSPASMESKTSLRPSGDQRGVPVWLSKLVSWSGLLPSLSQTEMLPLPARSDWKAIFRPSGE